MSKNNSEAFQYGLPGYDMRPQQPRLPQGLDVTTEVHQHGNELPPCLALFDKVFTKIGGCRYASKNGSTEAKMHFFVRLACPQEAVIVKSRNGIVVEATTSILDDSLVQELEKEEKQKDKGLKRDSNESFSDSSKLSSSTRWLPQALMSALK